MNRHRATHTSIINSNEVDVAAIKSIDQKASTIARTILDGFNLHYSRFREISAAAKAMKAIWEMPMLKLTSLARKNANATTVG